MKTIALVLIGFVLIGVLGIGGLRMFSESTRNMIAPQQTESIRIQGKIRVAQVPKGQADRYELETESGTKIRLVSNGVDVSSYLDQVVVVVGSYHGSEFLVASLNALEE